MDAIKSDDHLVSLLEKAKKIVRKVKKSSKIRSALSNAQILEDLPSHVLLKVYFPKLLFEVVI